MRIYIRLFAAAALALLLCLVLIGCKDDNTPADTGVPTDGPAGVPTEAPTAAPTEAPTEPATEPEEMKMEPKTTLTVIEGGKTDYTVVLGDGVADANRADLDWLYKVMDEKYGTHPAEAASGTGKVITLMLDGNAMDWSFTADEKSGAITLTAGSPATMKAAINYFATQCCGYSDGSLLVDTALTKTYTYAADKIDNSSLLSYEGGSKTVVAPSDENGKVMSPAWLDSAIMVEVRLDTASIGGTFQSSRQLIDFYASAGVNVIWLVPIYQRGAGGNGYGNVGLHTVEPALTGTNDMDEGWQVVKEFVDYAHSKGVYILLDIVTWGTMKSAPLIEEHPTWFSGEAWGNAAFNWSNKEFREWFINQAVTNIEVTGADGYRCDCEPFTAGYTVYREIRERLNAKGIYPVIMSEDGTDRRQGVFDCEQDGVLAYNSMSRGELYQKPVNFFADGILRMMDSIEKGTGLGAQTLQSNRRISGTGRYYTNCITNHDYQSRNVNGNRIKIGYSAIYAPYIPVWYMGDEFGVQYKNAVLYDIRVDYGEIDRNPEQAVFFEDVKQMINIRRTYGDIFGYWPLNHRETNICQVTVEGLDNKKCNNYARYMGDRMIIVAANNKADQSGVCKVAIPFEEGFAQQYYNYRVTDLLTGTVITVGRADTVNNFSCVIPNEYCGVYLVEGIGPIPAPEAE